MGLGSYFGPDRRTRPPTRRPPVRVCLGYPVRRVRGSKEAFQRAKGAASRCHRPDLGGMPIEQWLALGDAWVVENANTAAGATADLTADLAWPTRPATSGNRYVL